MNAEAAVLKLERPFREHGLSLEIALPSGRTIRFGDAQPSARLAFRTPRALKSLLKLHENRIVESYLKGDLDIEGSISELFRFRRSLRQTHGLAWIKRWLAPLLKGQMAANRAAIGKHYELDPEFYFSFLDSRWPAYSQGIYEGPGDTLAAATERKFAFAAAACRIGPESHVLEVGPGWGAFLKYLQPIGARATALTNSGRMKAYLDTRFNGHRTKVVTGDFLSFTPAERFSALTMMGVLEHLPQYERVCRRFKAVLEPGRRAYIDASAARKKYSMSAFIYKHVFPYNHSFLHLESFLTAAEKEKLQVVELHDDSDHYRRTIAEWASNLENHREELERTYGSYHVRRFRLYLWGSVHAFEEGALQCHRMVLQAPS